MKKDVQFGKMIHGGDYNPEQWLDFPEILEKILHILKKQELTKYHWAFFPGPFWNLMRGSFILHGCRKLLIGYMKMIFL